MAKQSKSQIVKEWKSSDIKIKKDSKGLLWVVLGKEKVKLPKDLTNVKSITLSQAEGFIGLDKSINDLIGDVEKNKGGGVSLYKSGYDEQARKLCLLGATDVELADFFGVVESTINKWKLDFPSFSESIKKGKEYADANVANKLYNRALGYEHKEDKIFNDQGVPLIVPTVKHYPPDTTAAIFWLKNRQPAKWREKQEVETTLKIEQPLFGDD
ncbi:hypothetical protein [Empedobacter sp.]|uniref:hypothetical protein n=1 Tax=Empedobacter sp. TaxID=1927715 RepID=UPI0028AD76ED|nr:hypothetical protein [Empedobacter sp.]